MYSVLENKEVVLHTSWTSRRRKSNVAGKRSVTLGGNFGLGNMVSRVRRPRLLCSFGNS